MALSTHATSTPKRIERSERRRSTWGEHIVTVVAAGIAMLLVAVIAVLMGMA